jgi:tRNA A-37 threonylcarbamoyl transferase component Bud32
VNTVILGTTLGGRYRLDARIGHGGMSTVYRAFDTVLEREVAIKLMHREIASDSDQLERFRREARAVAQLNHPHIVRVIDAGEWGPRDVPNGAHSGAPYIVLEYVAGETLKEQIRREAPMEAPTVLAYGIEIARALGAAHDREIVHRDVKPQNILLSDEGGAKITDFGIARTLTEVGLTMDGRVLGTTDYVSPEQALGQPVTGQSDVYSLGVVLYEMLTGAPPFKGPTPVAVAMMHVREEVPDVHLSRADVSAATAAVVERATAKSLDRRYPDIASMVAELEEALAIETARSGQATGEVTAVLRTLPAPARRLLPWRTRHPARWAISLLLLAGVVAATLVAAAGHTHSGTGVAPDVHSAAGTTPVVLGQTAASSYNPFGTGPEHAGDVASTIDGDPNTSWSTEHYLNDKLDKAGLGVALDATPGVVARAIEIQTPSPGFTAAVYGSTGYSSTLSAGSSSASSSGTGSSGTGSSGTSSSGTSSSGTSSSGTSSSGTSSSGTSSSGTSSSSLSSTGTTAAGTTGLSAAADTGASSPDGGARALAALGWTQLASAKTIRARTTIPINRQGLLYLYYLVWITKLPPNSETAQISELTLFK